MLPVQYHSFAFGYIFLLDNGHWDSWKRLIRNCTATREYHITQAQQAQQAHVQGRYIYPLKPTANCFPPPGAARRCTSDKSDTTKIQKCRFFLYFTEA